MSDQLSEYIREKCFDLCSQYIWSNVSRSDISYERITGGVTNQMIKCKLLEKSDETIDGKPKQIALKLYRKVDRPLDSDNNTHNTIFNDMVIGLIVSERGLGPKIYGLSSDAVIMEYIEVCILPNVFTLITRYIFLSFIKVPSV